MKSFHLFLGLFFLLFLVSCVSEKTSEKKNSAENRSDPGPRKVWVDADLAIGVQNPDGLYGDVDDGFALVQLLLADEVEVVGVSTVFGNTNLERAYALGLEIRDQFASPGLKVFKGAAQAIDLAKVESNEAVEALAAHLQQERITIMAIGPATNIGLLLLLFPELAGQIESIVLVAGRRSVNHHFKASETHDPPFPDLNFELDPDAFRVMLQHDIKVVLHPFEISHKVWFGEAELQRLKKSGPAGTFLADRSQNWLKQWESWGTKAYNPFDLLASSYLVADDGFLFEELPVQIQIAPDDRTRNDSLDSKVYKPYLIVAPDLPTERKVWYYHTPPRDFTERFFTTFEQ